MVGCSGSATTGAQYSRSTPFGTTDVRAHGANDFSIVSSAFVASTQRLAHSAISASHACKRRPSARYSQLRGAETYSPNWLHLSESTSTKSMTTGIPRPRTYDATGVEDA